MTPPTVGTAAGASEAKKMGRCVVSFGSAACALPSLAHRGDGCGHLQYTGSPNMKRDALPERKNQISEKTDWLGHTLVLIDPV